MADYQIAFARSARRELESLDNRDIGRILARIEATCAEQRTCGAYALATSVSVIAGTTDSQAGSEPDWIVLHGEDSQRFPVNRYDRQSPSFPSRCVDSPSGQSPIRSVSTRSLKSASERTVGGSNQKCVSSKAFTSTSQQPATQTTP